MRIACGIIRFCFDIVADDVRVNEVFVVVVDVVVIADVVATAATAAVVADINRLIQSVVEVIDNGFLRRVVFLVFLLNAWNSTRGVKNKRRLQASIFKATQLSHSVEVFHLITHKHSG